MADVVVTCSRCGKLIEGGPALVVVQSGPRAPAQPVVNLCPHCADSLSQWFARRHHIPAPDRAAEHTEHTERRADSSHPHRSGHNRQHRRWRRTRRKLIRGAVAIAYVFITFSILSFVAYQVWRLSSQIF
jgi:hypothetical protein